MYFVVNAISAPRILLHVNYTEVINNTDLMSLLFDSLSPSTDCLSLVQIICPQHSDHLSLLLSLALIFCPLITDLLSLSLIICPYNWSSVSRTDHLYPRADPENSERGSRVPHPPHFSIPLPTPRNENFTFQEMQLHTALWAYSWCKVK